MKKNTHRRATFIFYKRSHTLSSPSDFGCPSRRRYYYDGRRCRGISSVRGRRTRLHGKVHAQHVHRLSVGDARTAIKRRSEKTFGRRAKCAAYASAAENRRCNDMYTPGVSCHVSCPRNRRFPPTFARTTTL